MRRHLVPTLVALTLLAGCSANSNDAGSPPSSAGAGDTATGSADSAPARTFTGSPPPLVQGHPRLWMTPADLPRLRSWASSSNPLWKDDLAPLIERSRQEMDRGDVPGKDCGTTEYEEYAAEMYAELFAFDSLVDPEPGARADSARRARELLLHVLREADKGPSDSTSFSCGGTDGLPPRYRSPRFMTEDSNRARYHGEAYPLVVDWIYPSLSKDDLALVQRVFLRWTDEIRTRGYHHPEPVGVHEDPVLLQDRSQVRWSGNNYYTGLMRNLGMMGLALDPADDPGGRVRAAVDDALGTWLYVFENLVETDARGGLLPEGYEYSPQTASYVTQLLLAVKTASEVDPSLAAAAGRALHTPFLDDLVGSWFQVHSPATQVPKDEPDVGPVHLPAAYGDLQAYRQVDSVSALAPIGLLDERDGNTQRLDAVRWIQTEGAPGGREGLPTRAGSPDDLRNAILYFMLLDPASPPLADPRPRQPLEWFAAGMNKLYARTGWGADAAWFTYSLPWNHIDHQNADGNDFGWYRNGEWLTKRRTGYADIAEGIASSEYANTVAVRNDKPDRDASDWRTDLWQRGSQWNLVPAGDPTVVARSSGSGFTYVLGDATQLYNSTAEAATAVDHVSRSIVWLQPDAVVIYDRVERSRPTGFARWWLQLPAKAKVEGSVATVDYPSGQRMQVHVLLPAGAHPKVVDDDPAIAGRTASAEPMTSRLMTEAPGDPQSTRFLHVLVASDEGGQPATVAAITGDAVTGAVVGRTAVVVPVDVRALPSQVTYRVPVAVDRQLVTGLEPGAGYTVDVNDVGGGTEVTVTKGGPLVADAGGVVAVGG